MTSEKCSRKRTMRKCAATKKAASASTSKAADVKRAAAMESSKSKCTFCRTSTCRAKCSMENATTEKRWTLSSKGKISRTYSICVPKKRWNFSATFLASNGNCKRSSLRSEEHTSELQSREKLVCRLL